MRTINIFKGSRSWVLFNLVKICFLWILTLPSQLAFLLSNQKDLILSDVHSYRNMVFSLILDPHYRNLFYHRIGKVSVMFSWCLPGEEMIIPFTTRIGRNALFIHNRYCHLNAESIGDNFTCYQGVVIGTKSIDSKGKPKIGNNVTLATGVVVVGEITIGDNVKIAANSFVCASVPSNCIVMGNPAFIVRKNGVEVFEKL